MGMSTSTVAWIWQAGSSVQGGKIEPGGKLTLDANVLRFPSKMIFFSTKATYSASAVLSTT